MLTWYADAIWKKEKRDKTAKSRDNQNKDRRVWWRRLNSEQLRCCCLHGSLLTAVPRDAGLKRSLYSLWCDGVRMGRGDLSPCT